jgi:Dolichyl-phosphate-mannose-protein mannosyltransferase
MIACSDDHEDAYESQEKDHRAFPWPPVEKTLTPWLRATPCSGHLQVIGARWGPLVSLVLLLPLSLVLATSGITDEGAALTGQDMPRYLMDGAFVRDFLVAGTWSRPVEFASLYYARYPALGFGHLAILPALAEAPAYMALGVSVSTARLSLLPFVLLLVASTFLLSRAVYGPLVGFVGTLLVVTNPVLVKYFRVVMSEIPTLALVVLAFYLLQRVVQTPSRANWGAFLLVAMLSVYAKQVAALLFPAYAVYLWRNRHRLPSGRAFLAPLLVAFILFLPIAGLTVLIARAKLRLVFLNDLPRSATFAYYLTVIWTDHLVPLVAILAAGAVLVAIFRRDRRPWLFVLWIGVYYVGIAAAASDLDARYAFYWIPALSILAASVVTLSPHWLWRGVTLALLTGVVAYQLLASFAAPLPRADGYEEAARLVVEARAGPTVLYRPSVDTGLFIFFVRKHDPTRDLIVLRADKILATRYSDRVIEDRTVSVDEIHDILTRFGTGYVVIEETIGELEAESPSLRLLRDVAEGPSFTLVRRVPLRISHQVVKGGSLAIYLYRRRVPPRPGQVLEMRLPLANRSLSVPFDAVQRLVIH